MNSVTERLTRLRVSDLMSESVVSIPANATMAEAADTLIQHDVRGAPVLDEQGHCVGVITAADFASRDRQSEGHGRQPFLGDEFEVVADDDCRPLHIEHVANECVHRHMTPAVQSISEKASMLEAGRCMCAEHVHRLVVLDERSHPLGVISSLDLVAAMIGAVEE